MMMTMTTAMMMVTMTTMMMMTKTGDSHDESARACSN